MARYPNEPPEPIHHRSAWLLTTVLLLIVFGLVFVLWRYYMGGVSFRFAPSPTPSATPASPLVATVDFRSTIIAQDRATQIAFEAVVPRATSTPTAIELLPESEPEVENPVGDQTEAISEQPDVAASATAAQLNLVPIGGGEQPPTATPTLIAPDVNLPTPDLGVDPNSPLATPAEQLPIVLETETPTPTETILAPTETPSPTFTPSPTPTFFQVQTLRAYILPTLSATTVWARLAPMNTHTPVATLIANTQVDLRGRDESGEWVYFCCVDNEQRWIRQAYAPPAENDALPDNAPPSATPNDVRWLPVQPWPGNFAVAPVATPILADNAIYARQDRANTGRIASGLNGSLTELPNWSVDSATISQQFAAPLLVVSSYVVGATRDGIIYGFDRNFGNQTWTYGLGAGISQPMFVIDNILYVGDDSGRISALPLGGNGYSWQQAISIPNGPPSGQPASGFVARDNFLYLIVRAQDSNYHLLKVDRGNGAMLQAYPVGATPPQGLAYGHQLIYVAGARLWALDVDNFELVWENANFTNFSAPPVYAANGIKALSELFVTTVGQVYVVDAATGKLLQTYEGGGQQVTGLALGENAIFASGSGFIKAFDRRGTGLFWNVTTGGIALGGPIVSPDQLLLVIGNGAVESVNPSTGALTRSANVSPNITLPPTISGRTVYVASEIPQGRIHAFVQP